ncbi:MAG TPA: kelch repeat-containing protein [Candidatus Dormibacteraeota bacterium]|nr:kelch repeat-containing protein [Candidatus Dormibacteraeota bacterium]
MTVSAPDVCARHGIETRLKCASCQTPICLRCQVRTEVGLKCPDCAKPAAVPPPPRSFSGMTAIASVAVGIAIVVALVVVVVRLRASSPNDTIPPPPAPVGAWTALPDLSTLRGGTTAVLLGDGRIMAVGGGIGAIPLSGTEIYDPTTQRWTASADLAQARRGNETVVLGDGRVLVSGGIAGSKVLASTEIYDPAKGRWATVAPMHEPRFDHMLTVLQDGRVLAVGGTSNDGSNGLSTAEIYNPKADTWTMVSGGMSTPRTGARAVLLKDGRVLVVGGVTNLGPSGATLDSAEIFDAAGNVFTHTGSLRQARADLTLTLLSDGRVLAAGGMNSEGTLATAEILDPVVGTWAEAGAMATSRHLATASRLANGEVLVTGGETTQGGTRTSLTAAELYDPAGNSWKPATSMSCPRFEAAQVTLQAGTKAVVIGGDTALPGEPTHPQSCSELFTAP